MKEIKKLLPFFLLPVLITFNSSCKSELDKEEYVSWIEDYENGLHVTRDVGEYNFDLQYKPSEYLEIQTAAYTPIGNEEEGKNNMQYYTLTVSLNSKRSDLINHDVKNAQEKAEKLYYLSYQFANDIFIEENGERFPCQLFHFERSYDLKPSRTFVLGFENPKAESASARLIIDSPYFKLGPVKIKVNKNNIPDLKQS